MEFVEMAIDAATEHLWNDTGKAMDLKTNITRKDGFSYGQVWATKPEDYVLFGMNFQMKVEHSITPKMNV